MYIYKCTARMKDKGGGRERRTITKTIETERGGKWAELNAAKRRNTPPIFFSFPTTTIHVRTVIVYFVLALRSAFRNELSYGAKTPIDTVCITPVCNDRCLRVCAILSPSLPLSRSHVRRISRGNRMCPVPSIRTHPCSTLSEDQV